MMKWLPLAVVGVVAHGSRDSPSRQTCWGNVWGSRAHPRHMRRTETHTHRSAHCCVIIHIYIYICMIIDVHLRFHVGTLGIILKQVFIFFCNPTCSAHMALEGT